MTKTSALPSFAVKNTRRLKFVIDVFLDMTRVNKNSRMDSKQKIEDGKVYGHVL